MLYSMTGYGRVEKMFNDNTYLIELRSLNGKQFDLRLNISSFLKPYEIEIRNIISEKLLRGSVECSIVMKQSGVAKPVSINNELLKSYYRSVKQVADELNIEADNVLNALLKLPDVVMPNTEQVNEKEWTVVKSILYEAVEGVMVHRKKEGEALEEDLLQRITNIEKLEKSNELLAPARKEKMRENLLKLFAENAAAESFDENRLEQELIYYIEKLDISEEQVRLKNHCAYFRQILQDAELSKGKKLSFLLQEIGREINTTGAKANDANIQKNVVLMKDELEKAKEQILNVL